MHTLRLRLFALLALIALAACALYYVHSKRNRGQENYNLVLIEDIDSTNSLTYAIDAFLGGLFGLPNFTKRVIAIDTETGRTTAIRDLSSASHYGFYMSSDLVIDNRIPVISRTNNDGQIYWLNLKTQKYEDFNLPKHGDIALLHFSRPTPAKDPVIVYRDFSQDMVYARKWPFSDDYGIDVKIDPVYFGSALSNSNAFSYGDDMLAVIYSAPVDASGKRYCSACTKRKLIAGYKNKVGTPIHLWEIVAYESNNAFFLGTIKRDSLNLASHAVWPAEDVNEHLHCGDIPVSANPGGIRSFQLIRALLGEDLIVFMLDLSSHNMVTKARNTNAGLYSLNINTGELAEIAFTIPSAIASNFTSDDLVQQIAYRGCKYDPKSGNLYSTFVDRNTQIGYIIQIDRTWNCSIVHSYATPESQDKVLGVLKDGSIVYSKGTQQSSLLTMGASNSRQEVWIFNVHTGKERNIYRGGTITDSAYTAE